MLTTFIEVLKLSALSFWGWLVLAAFFVVWEKLPRFTFIVTHYLTCILTFALVSWIYARFVGSGDISPFRGMIIAMITLFVIEGVFFRFVYTKSLWFLNFTDWIVPAFLIASSVYLALEYFSRA